MWHSYLTGKGKAGRRDRRGGLLQVLVVNPASDNNNIQFVINVNVASINRALNILKKKYKYLDVIL